MGGRIYRMSTSGRRAWEKEDAAVPAVFRRILGMLDAALDVLRRDGLTARRNGVGVIVDVAHGEKARPIHTLHQANIRVTDFEME